MSDTSRSVGVAMSLFNQAHWVEEALESILSQTHPPDKIVIVDDGSTDGGPELAKKLGGERVDVLRLERTGVSTVLNTGVQELNTDFVAILASDDVALPDRLEWQLDAIQQANTNAVFALPKIIDEESQHLPDEHVPELFAFKDDDMDPLARLFQSGNYLCASSAFVSRKDFLDCGGFHRGLLHLQDFFLWSKLAGRLQPIVMNERLVAYRRTSYGGNLSSETNDRRMRSEFAFVYQEFLKNVTSERFVSVFCDGVDTPRASREIELHLDHADLLIYQAGIEKLLRLLDHSTEPIRLWGREVTAQEIFELVGNSDVDRREHLLQIAERLRNIPPWNLEE